MKKRQARDWMGTAIAGFFVLVYCLAFYGTIFPVLHPRFTLVAQQQGEDGSIALDTAFILADTRQLGLSPEDAEANIAFTPPLAGGFTVEAAGAHTLRIVPGQQLPPSTALTVQVYDQSFEFTTENRLLVQQAFPRGGAQGVPITTGIELELSTAVEREAFIEAFTISPAAEGRFRILATQGRYIFTPDAHNPLAYNTLYTVTLNASLTAKNGAVLGEDYSFSFVTEAQPSGFEPDADGVEEFHIGGNGYTVNALTSEPPVLSAYISAALGQRAQLEQRGTVPARVYAFSGWQAYVQALEANMVKRSDAWFFQPVTGLRVNTTGLAHVGDYDIKPFKRYAGDSWYMEENQWALPLPEALPAGWYVVQLELEGRSRAHTRQVFLQVSDLSVFTMWHENHFLAWVNDAATGQPVPGADVEMQGGYAVRTTTGADGTAYTTAASMPDREEGYGSQVGQLTVTAGEQVFVDVNQYYYYDTYGAGNADARRYMAYLYVDRPIYHTTDTVHTWGMVRPRDAAATEAPQQLSLAFSGDNSRQTVSLRPDGTFTAQIRFADLAGGDWASVDMMLGETVLASQYFSVEDFVKPVFTSASAPTRPVYLLGVDEAPQVEVDISTFDGTPATEVPLEMTAYSYNGASIPKTRLVTDQQGRAVAQFALDATENSWRPGWVQYSYTTTGTMTEEFQDYGGFYIIQRDVMLRAQRQAQPDGSLALEVTTHRVSTDGIEGTDQLWQGEALKGEALSIPVTAEVYRHWYEKTPAGTYYDFINRQVMPRYTYTPREERVATHQLATENGAARLEGLPRAEEGEWHVVKLQCQDSLGRPVEATAYLNRAYHYNGMRDGTTRYEVRRITEDPPFVAQNATEEDLYYASWYGSAFYDGENTRFALMHNEERVAEMQGRLLTCVVQDGFSHIEVGTNAQFTLPFSEQLLPNYLLTGAYFDGRHVFMLQNTRMHFDPAQRELEIELQADKDSYAPGEDVAMTAVVRNKLTGQPVPGVSLVLSAVDEAVFAVKEQRVDFLQNLYSSIYWPDVKKYASFQPAQMPVAGEKGGGGGGPQLRTDFEDTAYFGTATTNDEGRASFAFGLPHNITSWRLTALGISGENHAGNTSATVAATRPFFVMPVVNRELLAGDTFNVGLRSLGQEVGVGDQVEYTVRLQGPGVDTTVQHSATARTFAVAYLGLPGLAAGEYTVTVEGRWNGHHDGVQLPVTVRESGVEVRSVRTVNLAEGLGIEPLRYPVSLVLYSEGGKSYNEVLRAVQNASWGGRADARLARVAVAQLLKQGGQWYDTDALEQSLSDINGKEMLRLLPYGETDFELSLLAHMAAPELVSLAFFTDMDDSYWETSNQATWPQIQLAKALAGQPLDTERYTNPGDWPALSYTDKVWLAMALQLGGHQAEAQQWYAALVGDVLKTRTRADGATVATVPKNGSENSVRCTAAALMLASLMETEEAEALALGLAQHEPQFELYLLQQLYYLRQHPPGQGTAGASFRYTVGGVDVTEELGTGMVSLSFSKQQLAEADFTVLSGTVYADVYSITAPAALPASTVEIGLEREIEAVGPSGFAPGALVKITLRPSFEGIAQTVDSRFTLDEFIPAGLRFEQVASNSGWYLNSRQGQRLQFSCNGKSGNSWAIIYYARVALPGTYVVESAYIHNAYGEGVYGASPRGELSLR